MSSQRKEFRSAVQVLLAAAGTDCGDRVFENRVKPFRHNQLPAASIYTRGETASVNSEGPRLYVRECELVINIVVDGETDVDDAVDLVCDQIERALELSDIVQDVPDLARIELSRVEGPFLDRDGSRVIGGANLVYLFTYEDEITDDASSLEDLLQIHTEIDSADSRPGPELTDDLALNTSP